MSMSGGFLRNMEASSWDRVQGNPYSRRDYQPKVTKEQLTEQVLMLLDDWTDIKTLCLKLRRCKQAIRDVIVNLSIANKIEVKRLEKQSNTLHQETWHVYYRRKHETEQKENGNVCTEPRVRSKGSSTQADLGIR